MTELKTDHHLADLLVNGDFELANSLLEQGVVDAQVNQVPKTVKRCKNLRPLEITANYIHALEDTSLITIFSIIRRLLEKGATTTNVDALEGILVMSVKRNQEEVTKLVEKLLVPLKKNLTDLLLDQKYDEVDQLLNQELSVEQVNRQGTSDKMYPIEVVYEKLMENEVQYDTKQLALFFSIARRLIEKGARMPDFDIYQAMLELAEDQNEESLVFLLKASMYTQEELELELDGHLTQAIKLSTILKLKSQLAKKIV